MRQIREFQSHFENISRDCRTLVRVSHDFSANVTYFHLNSHDSHATFVRVSHNIHTCECRTTFIRMSLSFIFSPDSCEVFARLSHHCRAKLALPSCDTRTTLVRVLRKFRIVNSPKFRGNKFAILARTSHDSRTTVLRNILAKKSHKIFKHV